MKFGSVPDRLLDVMDLRLPPEPAANAQVLPGTKSAAPQVYVGAAVWGAPEWVGKIYPPKTPATKFRQVYPQSFNAIELNATHYNIYPPQTIQQWAAPAAGKDFKFCPKFPQSISHHSNFKNVETETTAFLEGAWAFEKQLGPAFLQLSETFSPQGKTVLFPYLALLPKSTTFFLEVRHPAWFADAVQATDLFQTLQSLHMGLVLTDTPGRRNLVHMRLTIPTLFLRFVCNGLHATSFRRTDAWVDQLKRWLDAGLQNAYIFLHPGADAAVPELAAYWIEQVNKKCNLNLKPPTLLQPRLF